MDSQMRIGSSQGQYSSYGETKKNSSAVPQNAAKPADVDVLELGKTEDPEVRQLEEDLERIRKYRFQNTKPKKKVQHNTAAIRGQILSSTSSMSARMALSSAYKEMASISVCTSTQGYDNKSAAKAMSQIKKVIAAGRMKVNNLSKEEQEELAIRRAMKRLENQEIRELNRELLQRRVKNRKDERRQIGNPKDDEADNGLQGTDSQSTNMQGTASLPTASLPTASLPTASLPTASLPTASISTASISTASISTASISTASISTASLSTASISTASISTVSLSTADLAASGSMEGM